MKRLRFTYKLVLITALASGLVWLLFGGGFFYAARYSLEEQLTRYQVDKAKHLMQAIDRSLFTARQGIQVLAQDGYLINLLNKVPVTIDNELHNSISEHLESIGLLTGPWQVVSVFDIQGNLLASNMPGGVGDSVIDHPERPAAFQAALDNRLYSSDLHLIGPRSSPSLIFAAPIHHQGVEESEVIGVVIGQYAWPVVTQLLDSFESHAKVLMLRDDGTIIGASFSDSHRIGSIAAEWLALQSASLNTRTLITEGSAKSEEPSMLIVATRQMGHLSYSGQDWILVLEEQYRRLLEPVYTLAWQLMGVALAGVFVLSGLLFMSGIYLTRPIGAMSRAVSAFSQGDMSARVDVNINATNSDEIADLGRVFNTMAEDIGYYIEQVKENSQEVRSFAYIVSHDLRAPLVNLKGFSTEIGYSLADLKALLTPLLIMLPESRRAQTLEILEKDVPEALKFIGSSVERMDKQIQAVLKLSRLGRRELKWERVDSGAIVDQVLSSLEHQLNEKRISVQVGTLPVVEADAFALEQIFGNLIDNAVKYMDDDIHCRIEIWSTADRQKVYFHIRDNGIGIDPVNIAKVFELFRRVGRTDVPGEGMGLAYVKTLVRRHGGNIWCESVLEEGSTFHFSLVKQPSIKVRELD